MLGPAASGKSAVAEALLAADPQVSYAATGPAPGPGDPEWAERVGAHRRRRPAWWRTLEGGDLAELLASPGPPLLIDSVGTWLSEALGRSGCWQDRPGWQQRIDREVDGVVDAWRHSAREAVAVVEEVGWGLVPPEPSLRRYRDLLGALARRLSAESEQVLLVAAGRVLAMDAPVQAPTPGAAR